MKSSFIQKDSWAWYVLIFPQLFFIYIRHNAHPPFFFKAIQSTFRLEEMTNSLSQQPDKERKRRATVVQTLTIAENSNTDLKKKLIVEEQARKSADATLKGAER